MVTQTGHLLLGEQCLVLCSGLGEGLVGDAESAARGERLESGRAARVKRVKPIPEPLVRAAKTYADEARRLGASLDDAFNALCAQW